MSFYRYLDDGRSHSYPTRRSSDLGTVYILEFSYSSNCTGTGPTLANAGTFSLVGSNSTPGYVYNFCSGWGLIKNTGTMTKTAGTNTDTFDVPVDNGTGGSLTVNTGVLDLDDG